MKTVTSVLLLAVLLSTSARLLAEERQTIDTHASEAATGLQRIEPLPANRRLHLAFGLPLRDRGALTKLLRQLYTPGSPKFHRYLTPDQFVEQFSPTEKDYQKVVNFATANGMTMMNASGNRLVLEATGAASDLEKAFHVKLGVYRHPTENRLFYGPDVEPTLDASLPIQSISGLDDYVMHHPNSHPTVPHDGSSKPDNDNGSGSRGTYLGSDFRNAYVPGSQLTGAGQKVGLVEFDGYSASDIQQYANLAGLSEVPLQNVLVSGFKGAPGTGNGEVALDIEVSMSMAPLLAGTVVYEATNNTSYDLPLMNEIAYPTQGEGLPLQISCSWAIGGNPAIEPPLLELAAQGQSFFYACGDSGAFPANTTTNSGNAMQSFMTVCGGTELNMTNKGAARVSETVWPSSSGGILVNVPIPFYQQPVNMSFNNGSTQWRNVPDVAMCGDQVEVIDTSVFTNGNPPAPGQVADLAGTSVAAPLWAGFAALVNQQAADEGLPPVGFMTPAIYEIAQSPLYSYYFHDITVGNDTNSSSPRLYYATNGYDLCSGWGTPTGQNLIDALTSLTGPIFVNFNYTGFISDGTYGSPYVTLAQGVNAVATGGTIFIETAGSSSETMTISKSMTITAEDGPASIGH